jgi:acetyl esterase/lipase
VVPTEPAVYRDRAYGADDRQRMDLYVPAGPGPHPVVAWVHGGGWQTGDKDLVPPALRDALVANGYAVAAVNYRLSGDPGPQGVPPAPPAVSHPYPLMDIKNAVRWLQEHAGPYALDPTAVVLSGYSAGGHLAVLAATSADAPALVGPPVTLPGGDPPLRGVLAYAAPLDLALVQGSTLEVEQRALRGMIGCPAVGTCDTRGADARTYLDPGDPPIALVSGTADLLVPPTHAASFQATADEVGYTRLTRHEEAGFTHEMVSDVPDIDFALGWLRLLVG